MLPWMRGQIVEAWHSRKNSRASNDRRGGAQNTRQNNHNDQSVARGGNSEGSGSSEQTSGMLLSAAASSETFSVNIISLEGGLLAVTVKPSFTIERIKNIATKHFYGQEDTKKSATATGSSKYRLVHATGRRPLADDQILSDEDVMPSDELILVEVRAAVNRESLPEESLRGPNQETIDRLTADLPIRNPSKPVPSTICPTDFQGEFRKVLIALVQASSKILTYDEEAVNFLYDVVREKVELRCKPPSDPKVVKNLMDMGFSEKKVLAALHLRKMNTSEALDWLIEHQDDPDDDDELELPVLHSPQDNIDPGNEIPGPSSSSGSPGNVRKKSLKETCADLFKGGQKPVVKQERKLVEVIETLLETFRQCKKLDFKPSTRVKQSLIEMGFEEKRVVEALKITGNDQSNACEWLLGARRPSLQDLDAGLDPDGPIYQAIMNNPHIQLSLTNPKMLIAYLSILESPTLANVWINDPEVSPVLSQIFKTYHSEKHAIHMNRYDEESVS